MSGLLYVFAIVAGVLNTIQSGANVTLSKTLDQPVAALLVITFMSVVTYMLAIPFIGFGLPGPDRIAAVPWWGWIGGLLGGIYVLSMIFVAEKVGAAAFMGLTVTSALVTSLVLDHFGWLGFDVHQAGLWRVLGGVFMIAGLALICLF
ncbi:MAG: hypothetical protein JWR08_1267 [Enterovirga sp.]|jgi:transporter family-2 protein|nr:hypothetical protein [Enterovirga sp.]